jgi:hypothetical protein
MKRDPRMVERKKTGLAKARKRVRHLFSTCTSHSSLRCCSTPGLSGDLRLFVTFAHTVFPFRISMLTGLLYQAWQTVDSCVKFLLITKE